MLTARAPSRQSEHDLPGCNSILRRPGWAAPEVIFRIVHVAFAHGESFGDYREQTVEIAVGPKAAFENGNVGLLTRRVPPAQVINAVPPPRRKTRPRTPPNPARTPRIAETLRKAIEWRRQLDACEVPNQAAIARREGITRARVTQILGLLDLGPEIRQHILSMRETVGRSTVSERSVRHIAKIEDSEVQMAKFGGLLPRVQASV